MARGCARPVPAHVPRRGRRARLDGDRRPARHRRRLRRSPGLRRVGDRPRAGGAGLPRGDRRPARLPDHGRPAPSRASRALRRHHRRRHGLARQPLHGPEAAPVRRRLHAGRGGGQAARQGGIGLRPAGPRGLRADHAHRDRGGRGLAPANRPLRLLGGPHPPFGARGQRRRPARLRPGGEAHRRDRPAARLGRGRLRPRRRAGNGDRRRRPGHGGAGRAEPKDARPPGLRGGGPGQAHLRLLLEALPPRAQPRERPGDGAAPRPRQGRAARGGERAHAAALPPRSSTRSTSSPSPATPTPPTAGPTSRRWSRSAGAWPSCAAAPPAAPSAASPSTRGATSPRAATGA